jgi:predicted component of type VI protein secretion system
MPDPLVQPMLLDRLKASFQAGGQVDAASGHRVAVRRLVADADPVDLQSLDRVLKLLGGSSLAPNLVARLGARLKAAFASGRLTCGSDVHRLVREEFRAAGDRAANEQRSAQLMRASVERDLRDLLQMRKRLDPALAQAHPHVAASVLQQGLPDLSGTIARTWTQQAIELMIRDAVLAFEPRIIPDTLVVSVRPRGIEQPDASPSSESDEQRDTGWILRAYVCEIRGVLRSLAARVEIRVEAQMGSGSAR